MSMVLMKKFWSYNLPYIFFFVSLAYLYPMNTHSMQRTLDPSSALKSLSLRQKIAQLCIVAAVSNEEKNQELIESWRVWQPRYCLKTDYIKQLITQEQVGGIIFYGKKTLPQDQIALTKELQSMSSLPLIIAMDAERGLDTWFAQDSIMSWPMNITIGATADPELSYRMGYEIGKQLGTLGVNWNFAPVVDVNCNQNNPVIGGRSFGADSDLVSRMGVAFTKGLQDAGILACAKHFPGHGDTNVDSHLALPTIAHTRQRLDTVELVPFRALIQAGVKSIMLAHLFMPGLEKNLPTTVSHTIVTDLLKDELQYDGLIITDALGMKAVADLIEPGELEVRALEAGVDILLCPVDPICAIDAIEAAVHKGRLKESDIDIKVLKLLNAKQWLENQPKKDVESVDFLGNDTARAIKKQIYEKAITLVKAPANYKNLLEQTKPALISFSDGSIATAHLAQDLHLSYMRVPYNLEAYAIETLIKALDEDHVIISAHNPLWWNCSSYTIPDGIKTTIIGLKELKKTVTVIIFGSPYSMDEVQEADAIILGYEDVPDAHCAAAAILMSH
jgi:beta-N-acetylhexosaminidase